MINEIFRPFKGLISDMRKALIGVGFLVIALLFYIEFETSRNLLIALIGVISFSVGLWMISNEVLPLVRYRSVFIPFSVGLLFFLLWLESPFNEVLLDSELAKVQIWLTTVMSTTVYNYLLIIILLSVAVTAIVSFLLARQEKIHYRFRELPWLFVLIFLGIWSFLGLVQPSILQNPFFSDMRFEHRFLDSGYGLITFPKGSKASYVTIDSECSGIHSLTLFIISFYLALTVFFTQHKPKMEKLVAGFLVGTLGTLSSNWIRIAVILLVGYFQGTTEMLRFHNYAGLIIFLSWMLIFWMKSIDWMLEAPVSSQPDSYSSD
ncbi:MAG: exosortase/archaeosortase family protein [Candidatus Hodarchaeales archaeon]|jgi:exosortase/archaeosortase family protein